MDIPFNYKIVKLITSLSHNTLAFAEDLQEAEG